MIITVDGSSGSGKTSLCSGLAKKFEQEHYRTYSFSSGVLYRWLAKQSLNNPNMSLTEILNDFNIKNLIYNHNTKFFEYECITSGIYHNYVLDPDLYQTEDVASAASTLSQNADVRKSVRDFLLAFYNKYGQENNQMLFMDGRDLGSVVFKDTSFMKFYLEIDLDKAAKRRAKQLLVGTYGVIDETNSEFIAKSKEIKDFLQTRNNADTQRTLDPLKKTDDSIVLDTSSTTLNEMIDYAADLIKQRLKQENKKLNNKI